MIRFSEYLDEMLKSPEFKAEYDALESEFAAIQTAIDAEERRRKSFWKAAALPKPAAHLPPSSADS